MMDKNQKMIILELMNHETVSGSNLSSVIKMSTRSVRTIIKNINEDICGAKIESGSFGYRLTIETPETFLAYSMILHIPLCEHPVIIYIPS